MKKMNDRVLAVEEGVPGAEFGRGWQQEMLRALRAWERRNGIAEGGFRGMNSKLWRGRRRGRMGRTRQTLPTENSPQTEH